ncbi:MAG: hypothetical protein AB7S26_39565 [Sandaracinaceae bacterium]
MNAARPFLAGLALVVALAAPGCGASSRNRGDGASDAEMMTLSEQRALELIVEVLRDEGIARGPALAFDLDRAHRLDVDVRLAQTRFGIEWVSSVDRSAMGDLLPGPGTNGRLRIVPGPDGAQVLVLEHTSYEYANERAHVQGGVAGAREAEERLRRDVRDYLHYVHGRGAL